MVHVESTFAVSSHVRVASPHRTIWTMMRHDAINDNALFFVPGKRYATLRVALIIATFSKGSQKEKKVDAKAPPPTQSNGTCFFAAAATAAAAAGGAVLVVVVVMQQGRATCNVQPPRAPWQKQHQLLRLFAKSKATMPRLAPRSDGVPRRSSGGFSAVDTGPLVPHEICKRPVLLLHRAIPAGPQIDFFRSGCQCAARKCGAG